MSKRKRRKPDMRRIRPSATYTASDLAKAADRRIETIRRWYREGMPALTDTTPLLFDGTEVKAWLRNEWAKKKQPCAANEAYCARCRQPRRFAQGTTQRQANTGKTFMLRGRCHVCGAGMCKFQSAEVSEAVEPLPASSKGGYAA
jgi:hypothetical protein